MDHDENYIQLAIALTSRLSLIRICQIASSVNFQALNFQALNFQAVNFQAWSSMVQSTSICHWHLGVLD